MDKYAELDVYFHRLAPVSTSDEVLAEFYQDGYILCHYKSIASFSEDAYQDEDLDEDEEAAADLEDIVETAESGGICLIQLDADNNYYDRGRLLGVVPPDSDAFFIGVNKNGERTKKYTDMEKAKRRLEDKEQIEYIYKGIQIQSEKRELDSREYLLSAYEPPFTTFCRWQAAENQVRSLLSREQLPIDEPTSYSPDQTERLCEEYLREENEYYPLIQPGGSSGINQDFDLIGGVGEMNVLAEVKNIKGVSESALDDLAEEADAHTRVIYFSRNSIDKYVGDVEVILLDEVLDTLASTDRTRWMMEEMTTW
jgi:hypothetical protein